MVEAFSGSGEIRFTGSGEVYKHGNGIFSRLSTAGLKTLQKNGFELSRCAAGEVDTMSAQNKAAITGLVKEKLGEMF